ncbi:hypothetical protein GUJ93_ZPchr0013g35785 [Zizania palustris]|uniref:Guanylate kinase-like domain-containing protein n=1 Tax=Zizania palustris TaxID=103762 RepID=A0A8J5WVF0_ZIZPA|nr:hypothetical protein GUJ93_ZPchr0013g35785 [Zizania palustris]
MLLTQTFSSALTCSLLLPRSLSATWVVPTTPPDQLFRGLEVALGTTFSSEPLALLLEPMIVVISGLSGVGKDAVIKKWHEEREWMHFVVIATCRGKQHGEIREIDVKDYYFVVPHFD